ncbi:MAG: hypothetical protein PF517_13570 [Salinivirgaceae bacterium]|jgi:Ca2+/Na+ antiporter|nr:hypothetical protein [Salinivirgaceae bacterium]
MQQNKKDSTAVGAIIGLFLPLIFMGAIILFSSSKFESIKATIDHFQTFDLLYKILSISLMPGAGLFLIWSKTNKLNQARGTLLMTLFYGVFVILLYLM